MPLGLLEDGREEGM